MRSTRAVENNIPVVRASLLGPSAVIDRSGRVTAYLPKGQGGVLEGSVSVAPGKRTLFGAWGNLPLYALLCLSIGCALAAKFLGRRG